MYLSYSCFNWFWLDNVYTNYEELDGINQIMFFCCLFIFYGIFRGVGSEQRSQLKSYDTVLFLTQYKFILKLFGLQILRKLFFKSFFDCIEIFS